MPKINEEKREENRNHILEVARDLFYENGYSKTSVNDIIKSAGMSKGRFYTYYESKENLFFDIIHASDVEIRQDKMNFDELGEYIAYRLKRFMVETNRIRAKYTLEFWSSAVLSDQQQAILDGRYQVFKKDIINIIAKGQAKGLYTKRVELDTFSYVLMSCIDGIISMDSVLNQTLTDEIIETTIQIFVGYLKEDK